MILIIDSIKMQSYLFGFLIGISLSVVSSSQGKLWALLVAGSNAYSNYHHQADICHAYQILRHHNVPAENIITMMYDDIANNSENPFPGTIINQPGGKNVYAGVVKDYTRRDVSTKNFINVLLGNKTAMIGIGNGHVIESGPDDIVFVNFVGFGTPGMLSFPERDLSVKELNNTLAQMTSQKKFKKLILYVEADFAGSMFDDILIDNADIFVMTGADPKEFSQSCYFDEERLVFLGDLFSVNWMQESEKEDLKVHSLHHIFEKVRTKTHPKSHVQEYGDLDIGNTFISEILGYNNSIKSNGAFDTYREDVGRDAVESYEVPLQILRKKLQKLENEAQLVRGQIRTIIENRQLVENVMNDLVLRMTGKNIRFSVKLRDKRFSINRRNIDCYDKVREEFSNTCFKIAKNPYVATQLHVLINACDLFDNDESKITRDIHHVCEKLQPMSNIV